MATPQPLADLSSSLAESSKTILRAWKKVYEEWRQEVVCGEGVSEATNTPDGDPEEAPTQAANQFSFRDDSKLVREFLNALGPEVCLRFFEVEEDDFLYLTGQGSLTTWRRTCLTRIRATMFVHVRRLREGLQVHTRFGYWAEESPLIPLITGLQELEQWLERFYEPDEHSLRLIIEGSQGVTRALLSTVLSVDARLFAACLVAQRSDARDPELCDLARGVIFSHLSQHLYGVAGGIIEDPSNLWWAVRIAVSDRKILERFPGPDGDQIEKTCSLISRAAMLSLKAPDYQDLSPLELTPGIYRLERMYSFVLVNLLEIDAMLTRNTQFRRAREHRHRWSLMQRLDALIDQCYAHVLRALDGESELNLYLMGTVNAAIVHWLAQARTDRRAKLVLDRFGEGTDWIDRKQAESSLAATIFQCEFKTANEAFAHTIEDCRNRIEVFLRSNFCKHPFVVGIAGPPGSGKSTLAREIVLSLLPKTASKEQRSEVRKMGALNLSTSWPSPSEDWRESGLIDTAFVASQHQTDFPSDFQVAVIDEADASRFSENGSEQFAYQWLLQPLWERWKNCDLIRKARELSGANNRGLSAIFHREKSSVDVEQVPEIPTVVFVIASRFDTWFGWYTDAMNRPKGRDFVSRVDFTIDFPRLTPEDQLLLLAFLFEKRCKEIHREAASCICKARLEHQARTLETVLKQTKKGTGKQKNKLSLELFPPRGDVSPQALTMQPVELSEFDQA